MLNLYGDISKFEPCDDGSVIIEGIASSETRDADGEIITADAMRKALPSFMQAPAVREMHDNIAAGKVISAFVSDDGNTHVTAKIVDKGTVQKIKDGILRGFSIFGEAVKKKGKTITELVLKTIDVVDLPNNPKAWFSIVKFDKPGDKCSDPECKHHVEGHKSKCASCKSKMEKAEHSESEKSMKKMLCKAWGMPETTSDEDFEKEVVKRLAAPPVPANESQVAAAIAKLEATVGDIAKQNKAANDKLAESERANIIEKMQRDCRVAMKEDGTAYTAEELKALDMPILKVLSTNAPKLPKEAKAVYKGVGNGPRIPENLKGFDRVEAAFEQTFTRN